MIAEITGLWPYLACLYVPTRLFKEMTVLRGSSVVVVVVVAAVVVLSST